jgi:hypothetical protein
MMIGVPRGRNFTANTPSPLPGDPLTSYTIVEAACGQMKVI